MKIGTKARAGEIELALVVAGLLSAAGIGGCAHVQPDTVQRYYFGYSVLNQDTSSRYPKGFRAPAPLVTAQGERVAEPTHSLGDSQASRPAIASAAPNGRSTGQLGGAPSPAPHLGAQPPGQTQKGLVIADEPPHPTLSIHAPRAGGSSHVDSDHQEPLAAEAEAPTHGAPDAAAAIHAPSDVAAAMPQRDEDADPASQLDSILWGTGGRTTAEAASAAEHGTESTRPEEQSPVPERRGLDDAAAELPGARTVGVPLGEGSDASAHSADAAAVPPADTAPADPAVSPPGSPEDDAAVAAPRELPVAEARGEGTVVGAQVALAAERLIGVRNDFTVESFVEHVLTVNHVPVPQAEDSVWVRELYVQLKERGLVFERERPVPGDLVFFHNTFDRNADGRNNDWYSHCGVVIRVQDDGTVVFVTYAQDEVQEMVMNLTRPEVRRDEGRGATLNSFIRPKALNDPEFTHYLSGELFAGFASVSAP